MSIILISKSIFSYKFEERERKKKKAEAKYDSWQMTIALHAWNYGSMRDVTRFKELRQAAKLRSRLRKAVRRNFQTSISWNYITTFISRYIFIPGVSKHETSFRAPRVGCRCMYDLGKHTQRCYSSFPRSSSWVCAGKLSRNSCRCGCETIQKFLIKQALEGHDHEDYSRDEKQKRIFLNF